ncbi:NAD(P)-binding protein, partial [Parathielavia hyrcaniae]
IPTDDVVLVTHGTQPIPLQIIKQLLELGCRVRTTLSWMESAPWLNRLFSRYASAGKFEHVTLPPGHPTNRYFYQEAVKGVTAVVHSATLPRFNHALPEIWSMAADSVRYMLEAAEHEPSVRAFVYTSSIRAAAPLIPQTDERVKEDSWNAKDTILALTSRGQCSEETLRNSSLVRAEQAVWQWKVQAEQSGPGGSSFKINVVSPANVIGQNFAARYTDAWQNWIWQLYQTGRATEEIPGAGPTQTHWYVDVEDVALLHIAAIFDPEIVGQRLHAWGSYRNWNDAIEILNEYDPESQDKRSFFGHDGAVCGQLYTRAPEVRQMLQRWKGTDSSQPCWKPFEKTICESVDVF